MEYNEKLIPILDDLENKEIEIAGGSTVGMVLGITNSLIKYICNLTIGKKKYEDVQDEVVKIKEEAQNLKSNVIKIIDEDKNVLENILKAYKLKNENPDEFEKVNKDATVFCLGVTKMAFQTLQLALRIEKVGNKMLQSDFKICKYYAFASVEASIVNIEINLKAVNDIDFVEKIKNSYNEYYNKAKEMIYDN